MEGNESQRKCKKCKKPISGTIYQCFFCEKKYCFQCKIEDKHNYFMEIVNYKQYEDEIKINPKDTSMCNTIKT